MSLCRLLTLALLCAYSILAHGGGLDAYGGHYNRKSGGYHFHRGRLAGQHFTDKAAAVAALERAERSDAQNSRARSDESRESSERSRKDQTVYITRTGAKYHSAGCSYLRSVIPISLKDAKARGYTSCSRCW